MTASQQWAETIPRSSPWPFKVKAVTAYPCTADKTRSEKTRESLSCSHSLQTREGKSLHMYHQCSWTHQLHTPFPEVNILVHLLYKYPYCLDWDFSRTKMLISMSKGIRILPLTLFVCKVKLASTNQNVYMCWYLTITKLHNSPLAQTKTKTKKIEHTKLHPLF